MDISLSNYSNLDGSRPTTQIELDYSLETQMCTPFGVQSGPKLSGKITTTHLQNVILSDQENYLGPSTFSKQYAVSNKEFPSSNESSLQGGHWIFSAETQTAGLWSS